MKLIYDPGADIKNWLRIKREYPNNFTITEHYPFDKSIDLEQENINKISLTIKSDDLEKFNKQAEQLTATWVKIESDVLEKIFKYLNKALPKIDFTANLTTAYYMPYDERRNWFMVPTYKPLNEQLKCIAHELFHLYQAKNNPDLPNNEREKEVAEFIKSLESIFNELQSTKNQK